MSDHGKLAADSDRTIGRWASWWLRAEPWPILLLALLLMFGYFWVYRLPSVAMVGLTYYGDLCLGSCLFAMFAAGRMVQLGVRRTYERRLGLSPDAFRSQGSFWPWLILIAVGTYYMVAWPVPMHAALFVSRPMMDRLADDALADPANAHLLKDRWAGLYRIAGVEVARPSPFYVGRDQGSYGFARVPGALGD